MNQAALLKTLTQSLHLLYVEDDVNTRNQIEVILKLLFGSVETAGDGSDGWKRFQNGCFDLVLTDFNMPGMDGIALTRLIKSVAPDQKVVMFSAQEGRAYLEEASSAGVDSFVNKPIEMTEFTEVIRKIAVEVQQSRCRQTPQLEEAKKLAEKARILIAQGGWNGLKCLDSYCRNQKNMLSGSDIMIR
jgi:CheY-like chemotaxis protein